MTTKEIILQAIENVNEELEIDSLRSLDETTPLFELLDSLGTLDLILELESLLEDETGTYIAIANEHSMDRVSTPFKTIVTLERFIEEKK